MARRKIDKEKKKERTCERKWERERMEREKERENFVFVLRFWVVLMRVRDCTPGHIQASWRERE